MHTALNTKERSILEGLLLGDGYLRKQRGINTTPTFWLKSITKSFIDNVKRCLPFQYSPIYTQKARVGEILGRKVNLKETYTLFSRVDKSLTPYYNSWYIDRVKVVPKELILTPETVKYWFYGDGSANWIKKHPNLVNLQLHTNGFTHDEVKFLTERLSLDCGLYGFNIQKSYWGAPVIQTSRIQLINDFFEYIGDCDVEGFKYKWKDPYKKPYKYHQEKCYHKSVIIDNVTYISQAEAARQLNVCSHTIGKRIKRGLYKRPENKDVL